MYLDVKVECGQVSFAITKVTITGIFVNRENVEVMRVVGVGTGVVPYPANDYNAKKATDDAIVDFEAKLMALKS